MKYAVPAIFLLLLIPAAAATTISHERIEVDLADPATVTVHRHYAGITSPRISFLAPARYVPQELEMRDGVGKIQDCEIREFEFGKEILCTPRATSNYSVRISFSGDLVDRENGNLRFSYVKRVLVPTGNVSMRLVLPEGYGVLGQDETPYNPADADVGSEGRRIFLEWLNRDVSLGDEIEYRVEYEKLAPFERLISNEAVLFVGVIIVLLSILVAGVYLQRVRQQRKTIASIFPVLKDDEQKVLRFIIGEDGEVEQREIVANVNYSKAKISRVLSDLEDRHVLAREKRGRVNIVTLSRDIGDLE